MSAPRPHLLAVLLSLLASPLAAPASAQKPGAVPGTVDASGRYTLSEAEQKLDCKKLTGRMQVRILQLRAELADPNRPSEASQLMQQITNPALKLMYGGASPYGSDRAGQMRRDHAMLDAYNRQLAAKSCATFDLAAELKKGPADPPPAPVKAAAPAAQPPPAQGRK